MISTLPQIKIDLVKTFLGLGIWLLGGIFPVFSDSSHQSPVITEKNLRQHIQFLCSNTLNGRLTGSVGEKLAARYIADQFQQLGLKPAGNNGTFFQDFTFSTHEKKHQHGR